MRWWLPFVLAGCYRTASFPSDAGQTDGTQQPDGPPGDSLQISACTTKTFGSTLPAGPFLTSSLSYSTDGTTAIFESDDDMVNPILEIAVDQSSGAASIAFEQPSQFSLTRPRLSPDGLQVFFLGKSTNAEDFFLLRSNRVAPLLWEQPIAVTVAGVLLDTSFVPGVPTNTDPRRMMVGRTNSAALLEGIEDKLTGAWAFTPGPVFPGFNPVGDPFLSSDGRALLFVGFDGTTVQIYRATRDDVESAFGNPQALVNYTGAGGQEHTPALSPDCETLYWGFDGAVTYNTSD